MVSALGDAPKPNIKKLTLYWFQSSNADDMTANVSQHMMAVALVTGDGVNVSLE